MNIFVGNLLFEATEGDVRKLFEGFGNVASVAIVMSKEKKAPKSRGFGFVEMPDEQQALASIAALNGKEFMGRILNVEPARPKTEAQEASVLKKKRQPGTYRGGRRTHSYMKRQAQAGVQEEAKPRRRSQENPMRWRKKKDQAKFWQNRPGEHKPWRRTETESKPWKKSSEEFKQREKPAGEAKPWNKSSKRSQESRFNPSTSLGMVRGNGERSRTKSRGKPGRYKRRS